MKSLMTIGFIAATVMAGLTSADAANLTVKYAHNGNTIKEDPQNVAADYFRKVLEEKSGGSL